MPELPEVETVKRALLKRVQGRTIVKVDVNLAKTINLKPSEFIKLVTKQKIININRQAKWLIFELTDYYLLSHLRMEGKYQYREENEPIGKHDLVVFYLDNKMTLRYNDTRRFGKMILINKDELSTNPNLTKLGPEPWDITTEELRDKLQKKTIAIKTALLDQTIIAGLGNIYVNEVLYKAKINPKRPANKVTLKELEQIIKYSSEVMLDSIKQGGTTIHNFESEQGVIGSYQDKLQIHGKKGETCKVCNTVIEKDKVNGRGTYYCPKCQKK
jgi:formamidopyrimidine-DNA glycosylase